MTTIAIIGGGAAGFFAAANLPQVEKVYFFEGTARPLTKVKISGGGRCNVTHNLFDLKAFAASYPRGAKELLGPFHTFGPQDTIAWFNSRGVVLKAEADGRMFPDTNKSQTIIDCLTTAIAKSGVTLQDKTIISSIRFLSPGFEIQRKNEEVLRVDKLLLATGSSPIGHKLAASLGHQIVEPMPSLFSFGIEDPLLTELAGISFRRVGIKLFDKHRLGPLVITHWGLSGPCVLWLSAFGARELCAAAYQAPITINWLGDTKETHVSEEFARLRRDMGQTAVVNPLFDLPKRFWQRLVQLSGIEPKQLWAELPKAKEKELISRLIRSNLTITSKGEFKEEFVTAGGIDRREIDFRTFGSKLCPGLFFAGEIIDIDGVTGGFNFQNAWTSGFLAAKAMASVG